jgi:hypothetical protein
MEVDVEFLKRELPMHFLELCKHQQDIIKCYEEYIEKFIAHQPIKSTFTMDPMARVEVKHITIPEARLVVAMTPACRQEWEYIKTMAPKVSPDYFIEMAYKEYMERKNAETN